MGAKLAGSRGIIQPDSLCTKISLYQGPSISIFYSQIPKKGTSAERPISFPIIASRQNKFIPGPFWKMGLENCIGNIGKRNYCKIILKTLESGIIGKWCWKHWKINWEDAIGNI